MKRYLTASLESIIADVVDTYIQVACIRHQALLRGRVASTKEHDLGTSGRADDCIPPYQHHRFGIDQDQTKDLCWLLVVLQLSDDILRDCNVTLTTCGAVVQLIVCGGLTSRKSRSAWSRKSPRSCSCTLVSCMAVT